MLFWVLFSVGWFGVWSFVAFVVVVVVGWLVLCWCYAVLFIGYLSSFEVRWLLLVVRCLLFRRSFSVVSC